MRRLIILMVSICLANSVHENNSHEKNLSQNATSANVQLDKSIKTQGNASESHVADSKSKQAVNLPVFSEGGPLNITVKNNNLKTNTFNILDEGIRTEKKSSIQPRKHAPLLNETDLSNGDAINLKHKHLEVNNKSADAITSNKIIKNITNKSDVYSVDKKASLHKKPRVLDVGDEPDMPINILRKANTDKTRVSMGHPRLVLPVVLAMISLPVFGAIVFFAIRRGQEAWKNRHYRRMDYLIDGMYND